MMISPQFQFAEIDLNKFVQEFYNYKLHLLESTKLYHLYLRCN